MGLKVKCDLKLKNVYIYDGGDAPHISLVDCSTGGGKVCISCFQAKVEFII